jgi:hypothetical protein
MYLRTRTIQGPEYHNPRFPIPVNGRDAHFLWKTLWETDARTGFIVQEVYTVLYRRSDSGASLPPLWSRYWEAWTITGRDTMQPDRADTWTVEVGDLQGTWRKTGVAYIVTALDPAAGFRPGTVREAGKLPSTYTQPRNLPPALLQRHVEGEWDARDPHPANCFHRTYVGNAPAPRP